MNENENVKRNVKLSDSVGAFEWTVHNERVGKVRYLMGDSKLSLRVWK